MRPKSPTREWFIPTENSTMKNFKHFKDSGDVLIQPCVKGWNLYALKTHSSAYVAEGGGATTRY